MKRERGSEGKTIQGRKKEREVGMARVRGKEEASGREARKRKREMEGDKEGRRTRKTGKRRGEDEKREE